MVRPRVRAERQLRAFDLQQLSRRADASITSRPSWLSMLPKFALMSLWLTSVLGALVLIARGLWAGFYIEPTGDAIARAEHGELLVLLGSGMLAAAAAFVVVNLRRSLWVGAALMAPVVITGGLVIMAAGTILAIMSIVLTFPMALGGCFAALTEPRRPA